MNSLVPTYSNSSFEWKLSGFNILGTVKSITFITIVCFPCCNVPFMGQGCLLTVFTLYPKQLEQFPAQSRH